MKSPGGVRRNRIRVPTRLRCRTDSLRPAAAVEFSAIKIALGRIFRGGEVVHPAGCFIHPFQADHVELSPGNRLQRAARARGHIDMTPTISLTQPKKTLAIAQPGNVINNTNINPGLVFFAEDGADRSGAGVANYYIENVLQPVELQQHNLV